MSATLYDYETAEPIREATPAELAESKAAATGEGGNYAGVIAVDLTPVEISEVNARRAKMGVRQMRGWACDCYAME